MNISKVPNMNYDNPILYVFHFISAICGLTPDLFKYRGVEIVTSASLTSFFPECPIPIRRPFWYISQFKNRNIFGIL